MKRSKPLQRKTGLKPGKGLAKVSPKRKVQNKEYARLREEFLEKHPVCECCMETGVPKPAPSSQVHHIAGRGRFLLRPDTWLATCGTCHRLIHSAPEWAYINGFLFTVAQRRLIA